MVFKITTTNNFFICCCYLESKGVFLMKSLFDLEIKVTKTNTEDKSVREGYNTNTGGSYTTWNCVSYYCQSGNTGHRPIGP